VPLGLRSDQSESYLLAAVDCSTICLFFYAFLNGKGREKNNIHFEAYFYYLEVPLFKLRLKASYTSSSRP
jgi:hypothetical protein